MNKEINTNYCWEVCNQSTMTIDREDARTTKVIGDGTWAMALGHVHESSSCPSWRFTIDDTEGFNSKINIGVCAASPCANQCAWALRLSNLHVVAATKWNPPLPSLPAPSLGGTKQKMKLAEYSIGEAGGKKLACMKKAAVEVRIQPNQVSFRLAPPGCSPLAWVTVAIQLPELVRPWVELYSKRDAIVLGPCSELSVADAALVQAFKRQADAMELEVREDLKRAKLSAKLSGRHEGNIIVLHFTRVTRKLGLTLIDDEQGRTLVKAIDPDGMVAAEFPRGPEGILGGSVVSINGVATESLGIKTVTDMIHTVAKENCELYLHVLPECRTLPACDMKPPPTCCDDPFAMNRLVTLLDDAVRRAEFTISAVEIPKLRYKVATYLLKELKNLARADSSHVAQYRAQGNALIATFQNARMVVGHGLLSPSHPPPLGPRWPNQGVKTPGVKGKWVVEKRQVFTAEAVAKDFAVNVVSLGFARLKTYEYDLKWRNSDGCIFNLDGSYSSYS